jgi:DNA-binding transcriptional MerR regulator
VDESGVRVSAGDLLRLTGLTYRQVVHWSEPLGILHPDNPKPGSGNPRTWPRADVPMARLIGELTRQGIDLHVAARVARTEPDPDGFIRVELGEHVVLTVAPSARGEAPDQ